MLAWVLFGMPQPTGIRTHNLGVPPHTFYDPQKGFFLGHFWVLNELTAMGSFYKREGQREGEKVEGQFGSYRYMIIYMFPKSVVTVKKKLQSSTFFTRQPLSVKIF